MSEPEDGREVLRQKIDAYIKEREKFAIGFVRFCLERGLKTPAPQRDGKPAETWHDAGRRLYGPDLFEATLAAEVEARRKAYAESRLPDVRGDKGKDGRQGKAAAGGKD